MDHPVLAGYRRTAAARGRGPARPFGAADLPAAPPPAIVAGRAAARWSPPRVALKRGRLDAVIAGFLFMTGMRRREVSALRWADVDGVLVTVRRSKTNQEGETKDVRFVKADIAPPLQTLRAATRPQPGDRVMPFSPQMVGCGLRGWSRPPASSLAADEPRRIDHPRCSRRELEDEPDSGALLVGRGNPRPGRCRKAR